MLTLIKKLNQYIKENKPLIFSLTFAVLYTSITFAAPYLSSDAILNPTCAPGDVDCYVSLYPDQAGNSGKFLTTNGTTTSWDTITTTQAIGDTITNATEGSILFAGASGVFAQDNSNFFWDANDGGRLGIGTNTPQAQLHVNASNPGWASALMIKSDSGNALQYFYSGVNSTNAKAFDFAVASDAFLFRSRLDDFGNPYGDGLMGSGTFYRAIKNLTNGRVNYQAWGIDGVEALTLDTNANLGVGTNTPGAKLHVYGGAYSSVLADVSDSTFAKIWLGAGINATNSGYIGYDEGGNERLVLNSGYSASHIEFRIEDIEKVRIDSTGNVGIGTSSPSAKLDVNGGSMLLQNAGPVVLTINDSSNTEIPTLNFQQAGYTKATIEAGIGLAGRLDISVSGSRLLTLGAGSVYGTTIGRSYAGTTAPADGLLIQGNVGIGTSTVPYKLNVNGGINITDPTYDGALVISHTANYKQRISGAYGESIRWGEGGNTIGLYANATVIDSAAIYLGNDSATTIYSDAYNNEGVTFNANNLLQQAQTRYGYSFYANYTGAIAGGTSNLTSVRINPLIETSVGTLNGYMLNIDPTINTSGGTTTVRGIYYNPTLTSTTGLTNTAIETVTGNVLLGTTSGNVGIGTSSPGNKLDITAATSSEGLRITSTVSGNAGVFEIRPKSTAVGGPADFELYTNGRLFSSAYEFLMQGPGGLNISGPVTATTATFTDLTVNALSLALLSQDNASNKGLYLGGGTTTAKTAIILTPTGSWGRDNFNIAVNNTADGNVATTSDIRFTIANSTGNVGIGLTSPSAKLDVGGGINIANNNYLSFRNVANNANVNALFLDVNNNIQASGYWQFPTGIVVDRINNRSGNMRLGPAGTQNVSLVTGDTDALTVDTSGNVFIGGSSASARLHTKANSASDIVGIFQGTTSQTGNLLEARLTNNDKLFEVTPTGVNFLSSSYTTNQGGIAIKYYQADNGGWSNQIISGTNPAVWTSGKGIYFANHSESIIVSSPTNFTADLAVPGRIWLGGNAYDGTKPSVIVSSTGNYVDFMGMKYASGPYPTVRNSALSHQFYAKSDAAWADGSGLSGTYGTKVMDITQSLLTIATNISLTAAEPHISSPRSAVLLGDEAGGGYLFYQYSSANVYIGAGSAANFSFSGTGNVAIGNSSPSYKLHVGSSSVSGIVARFENSTGTCDINPTTTSLSCSSDINLKKNITTLDGTDFILDIDNEIQYATNLDKLLALNVVTYNWNTEDDTANKHIGFIAQQVESVYPDLVTTDINTNLKSLNITNLTPYIIKGIQELDKKITSIETLEENSNFINTLRNWLASASNGIESVFARKIRTEQVCVKKTDGTEFCVNGDQLEQAVNGYNNQTNSNPAPQPQPDNNDNPEPDTTINPDTNSNTDTDTTPDSNPDTDTTIEPEPEPQPEPEPEPQPEIVPAPQPESNPQPEVIPGE